MKRPDLRRVRHLRHAAAFVFALAACAPLAAQSLRVLQAAPLRADRAGDAPTLATLAAGQAVTLLQMSGGWVQVQAGTRQGWLRASQLQLPGAEVAAASQRETGRRAPGASAVTMGVRSLPARSSRHALIVGVGQYKPDPARPVEALDGVPHDMASAMAMARLLQVPPEQVTVLRDAAATRDGVQQALRDLDARMQPGDRVFIYWSGHGSRFFDASAGGCVEALVPHDLRDIGNREFAQWIQPLASKADKMMVVYDACHSGGIGGVGAGVAGASSRSLRTGFKPKFTPGGAEACQTPSNMRSRSLEAATRAVGISGQDVVHVSSSRPDEVSFDNPASGGLATTSLRQCLEGEARDGDGSGGISVDELAGCAQRKIELALRGQQGLSPHHLVLTGNKDFVPAQFASAPPAPAVPATPPAPPPVAAAPTPAPAPVPAPTPAAPPALPPVATAPPAPTPAPPAPTPPAPPAAVANPPAPVAPAVPAVPAAPAPAAPSTATVRTVLTSLHAQRDSKRQVDVKVAQDRLKIGTDALNFSVTSSHAGHVYVALLGSDQQSLYLLFPNGLDGRNRIEAGQTLQLPRPAWRIVSGGPPGENTLLVMVSDGPRDLGALGAGKDGPFVKPLTDVRGRARLQWLMGQTADCAAGNCSDAFGSALLRVQEY